MKLLPQYSIRLMLGITAGLACIFSVVGLAARGHSWAIGVSVGVGALAVAVVTYAVFFGVLWVFSVVASPLLDRPFHRGRVTFAGTASPFADRARLWKSESVIDAIIIDDRTAAADGNQDSVGGDQHT